MVEADAVLRRRIQSMSGGGDRIDNHPLRRVNKIDFKTIQKVSVDARTDRVLESSKEYEDE